MAQDYQGYDPTQEEKFKSYSAQMEQITTRGDGVLEKKDEFSKDEIDFGASLEHLRIHHGGEVAGSQLNGEMFTGPDDVQAMVKKLLPEKLQYDQFGRAEITLDISHGDQRPIGWSGVKSLEEVRQNFPAAQIEQRARMPGGIDETVDGVEGAWYPETARNKDGRFEVVKDDAGNVKNPKAKFEPNANIVRIPKGQFQEASKTNKLTVIIQKDRNTQRPTVLTVFPGENAPAYPSKIDTADYKATSLGDTKETRFWQQHAFVEVEK